MHIAAAPLDKLIGFPAALGWSFNWAPATTAISTSTSGYPLPSRPREVSSLLVATEVAAFRWRADQRFRDNLPPIVAQNASGVRHGHPGYFSEGHAVSVFARDGDSIYYCYSSYTRGTEFLMSYYAILDRTPKGRNEGGGMGTWLRRHDEYNKR